MEIRSAIMYDNTTNNTNPKGRRQIHYGASNNFRTINPKLPEVYQSLSNVVEGILFVIHHCRVWNTA